MTYPKLVLIRPDQSNKEPLRGASGLLELGGDSLCDEPVEAAQVPSPGLSPLDGLRRQRFSRRLSASWVVVRPFRTSKWALSNPTRKA